jgi:hypothetical protein
MSRRSTPERLHEARRAANVQRLIGEGELPDRAEALVAAREAQPDQAGVERAARTGRPDGRAWPLDETACRRGLSRVPVRSTPGAAGDSAASGACPRIGRSGRP